MSFACIACGACCRVAGRVGLPHNGDNVCLHLENNKCTIYEDRPEICRVREQHKHASNLTTLEEWYDLNLVACGSLLANEIKNK